MGKPSYDPDSREQVKGRKQAVEARHARDISDLRALLAQVEGRRFLWRLARKAGVLRPVFVSNSMEIARDAGVHDFCLEFFRDLQEARPGVIFQLDAEFAKETIDA